MLLQEKIKEENIFAIMQYIGAILVIVSHAYPIAQGDGVVNPLYVITNGQLSFGELAVYLFFFVSGLFITTSVQKGSSFKNFMHKRILRIFPMLILTTFIITYVFGLLFTTINKFEYLTSLSVFKYFILNCLLIPVHHLPGVFEHTAYLGSLNGSLWTLAPQFMCYLLCYLAYKLKLLEKNKLIWTFPIVLFIWMNIEYVAGFSQVLYNALFPMMFFYMGCFFNVYQEYIQLSFKTFWLLVIFSLILIYYQCFHVASLVIYPYLFAVLGFCLGSYPKICHFCEQYFYVYYLLGFFVQRMITYICGGKMNIGLNILFSCIVVHILSVCCNLIVKKFRKGMI